MWLSVLLTVLAGLFGRIRCTVTPPTVSTEWSSLLNITSNFYGDMTAKVSTDGYQYALYMNATNFYWNNGSISLSFNDAGCYISCLMQACCSSPHLEGNTVQARFLSMISNRGLSLLARESSCPVPPPACVCSMSFGFVNPFSIVLPIANLTGDCSNGQGDLWEADMFMGQKASICLEKATNTPIYAEFTYDTNYLRIVYTNWAPSVDCNTFDYPQNCICYYQH